MQEQEVFKEIEEFPGYYVSNKGIVYSTKSGEMKPLAPGNIGQGYLGVLLCKNSKRYNKSIHRLVAEAFIPNPDNLETVNHRDEDKTNNKVDNLEWCSRGHNTRYSKCKPIIDLTTGIIYLGTRDADRALNSPEGSIKGRLRDRNGKYKGHKFMYLTKATDESVNTVELFGKKFEIPEVFELDDYELYDN